jgi:3-(3-hydroxy-phenyl)propionate hydroxylase
MAQRWRHQRVFLAGDAAHQMPPFMGQGMCSGIRDAAALAWRFADVINGGAATQLDDYEAERAPHTRTVIELSKQAGQLLATLADALARNVALQLPATDPPDERRWSRLPGLTGAAMGTAPTFPVGHQLPQPDRLDEQLGDGWVVVTPSADHPALSSAPHGVAVVVCPEACPTNQPLLVRPDRYIAQVYEVLPSPGRTKPLS